MELVRIIGGLLSVVNGEEGSTEFERVFDEWADPEALYEFFHANQTDLSGYSIEEAVIRTMEDAEILEDRFYNAVENSDENLQALFKPLSNHQFRLTEFQRSKAYGELRRSWLRIYAVRVDEDNYIVTGGAIKLSRAMQDRPHTNDQLSRLTRMRDYLNENGFDDGDIEDLET